MRRLLNFLFLAATFTTATCWAIEVAEVCGHSFFPDLRRHAAELDRMSQQHDEFMPRLARVLDEVALGRRSLSSACERMWRDAVETNPAFLVHVDCLHEGANLQVKLARFLLLQFEIAPNQHGASPSERERYERLAREYRQIEMQAPSAQ
jgi:cytosine/adenosine deaminase-related metal-dependent hydrolase